jgi:hypothetical protein
MSFHGDFPERFAEESFSGNALGKFSREIFLRDFLGNLRGTGAESGMNFRAIRPFRARAH